MAQQYDGSIRIDTKINQAGFNKGIAGIQGSVNRLGASLKSLAKTIGAAFGVAKIVQFGKEAISLASDLNEVQNVVETAFGGMSTQVDAWAKNSIKQFGMSELAAKRMASTYMSMSVGSGLQGQGAADMAMKTAERAADISSFYNKSLEESDTMLKSIWTGETESLKQIGVVMTQTNLDAFALANGFGKTTREMTQGEQIMLRYQYVMNQTRLAAGDFVKTQDSWANQTKVLSEQWKQFLSIMGGALIQVLTPALQFLNQFMSILIGWAQTFAAVVSALFGKQVDTAANAMSGAASSAGDLASSTAGAAAAQDDLASSTAAANKELQKQTASFDEMNILQSPSATSGDSGGDGAGGTGGSIGGGVSLPSLSGELGQGIAISPDLQNTINTVKQWFDDVQKAAQPTVDALAGLWEELKRLGTEFVWTGLTDFYNTFLVPLGQWTLGEGLPRFVNTLTNGLAQVDYQTILDSLRNLWDSLEPFAENVGDGLLWFWEEILVPMGTWVLDEAVPAFLDLLAAGVDVANTALSAAKEVLKWFWESFLEPIASWVGDRAIDAIDSLTGVLQGLSDWAENHGAETQGILVGLGGAFVGWKLGSSIGSLKTLVDNLKLIQLVKTPQDFKDLIQILFPKLSESLKSLDLTKLAAMGGMAVGIGLLAGSIYYLVTQWDSLSPAMKTAGIALAALGAIITVVSAAWAIFNINLLASPITWIVLGIAAVVAAFALLWENCEGFRNFWIGLWEGIQTVAKAVADWFVTAWQSVSDFFSGLWNSISGWASDAWNGIVQTFQGAATWYYNTVVKPVEDFFSGLWDSISGWASDTWDSIVLIWNTVSNWFDLHVIQPVSGFFTGLWDGIKQTFNSVKQWFTEKFTQAKEGIQNAWNNVGKFFSGIWDGIKTAFSHVTDWFKDVFSKAWEGVKNVFSTGGKIFDGIKDGIANVFKTVVNGLITGINKIIATPFNTINGMLNLIRSIDIMGFKPFEGLWGYNPLPVPQIPKLAQGAVIPPNQEMLAILGDQKKGYNLEGPESMFRQIVREESGNSGISGPVTFVLKVGETTLGRATLKSLQDIARQNGGLALDLR